MWNKRIPVSGKTRDLDGVFLQLDDVSLGDELKTLAGYKEMIGAKSTVPIGELVSEGVDKTREGARGGRGREGDEEEVSLFGVFSEERTVDKRSVEF